ncbi:peptide ABC transporter substrate-binding protein [Brevibacillus sp. B_LB10_24]|uniref:peptide ABC transporter substrate-binding protein n=1 Tax=Brevibacillus sp. B_LB10_24 TaxID=3380645 RepID=UPI0038B99BF5
MKKMASVLFSSALAVSMLLAGCTSSSQPQQQEQGTGQPGAEQPKEEKKGPKIFVYNNGDEPTSLDPPIGFDDYSYNILTNSMEGLTRLGQDHNPVPGMAKDWTISDDQKTYTFNLRDDAKWSNGDPVTAQDFEYAWKRLVDPAVSSPAASLAYVIEGAEEFNSGKGKIEDVKVTAKDDKTLVVQLKQPASWLIQMAANPAFFPVHKATVESNPNWAGDAATILSNGPFKITSWAYDSELKMEKNENYWDAANVKLDGIVWKMVKDANTEYQMYQNGELSATSEVPADVSEQLFSEGKVKVEDRGGIYYYRYNVKMKPFTNASVRKAFSMAIDRQKLVDYVTKTHEKPALGFVSYGYSDPAGGDFRTTGGDLIKFDPAEAKKLLEKGMSEEGWTTLPEVTITYNDGTNHQRVAQALQEMIKENLGVEVKLHNMEWKVLQADQKAGKLMMSRSSFLPDFGDPINALDGYQTGNGMNRTGWSNAQYDKLIKDAYNEPDVAKRFQMMHEAEKILMDESPFMPLYFYTKAYLQQDSVTGVVRHPLGYMDLKWADMN